MINALGFELKDRKNHSLMENGKYFLHQLDYDIVHRCNLNCKLCSHFSPCQQENENLVDIKTFRNDLTRMASMFNIYKLLIVGGEPLLHPKLTELLKIAREILPESSIFVVTNGLLLRRFDNDIVTWNNLRIKVWVSDYGILPNIEELLVHYRYKKYEPYVKGKTKEFYHLCLDLDGKQDAENNLKTCRTSVCASLLRGRLYHCPIINHLHYLEDEFNVTFNTVKREDRGRDIYKCTAKELVDYLDNDFAECNICNLEKREQSYQEVEYGISNPKLENWVLFE